jgi:hypothetical protein
LLKLRSGSKFPTLTSNLNGTTENAGEFRGGRCLSTIWGVHGNGNVYQRVNDVPPIKFAFGDIQWPTGWKCIEPKNNFKFSSNGNHNTGRPLANKRGKGRRIDWDRFDYQAMTFGQRIDKTCISCLENPLQLHRWLAAIDTSKDT